MAYYKDLREYLSVLEQRGKLQRIKKEINKDTEMNPLMRLQFRGLAEEHRKGFMFERITDSRGKKYEIPVVCCVIAGSKEIYAIGMNCQPEEIGERWAEAQRHPLAPRLVASGPVQEEVHLGDNLLDHGGLDEFPIPISTPGYDAAPFMTAAYWVTKDPESGIRNVGTYRAQVKSPTRTGINLGSPNQDILVHWNKCKEKGRPLEAAIVVGAPPNIGFVSVAKLAYGVDELAVAGSIAGAPIEVVPCRTVNLEVPAHAEIVIEGLLSTNEVEPEGPHGEALGYMGHSGMMPYFTVQAITHRKQPIWQAFLSQFPPSESSKVRQIAWENNLYKYLRHDLDLPIAKVAMHEASGSAHMAVLQIGKATPSQIWRALEASVTDFPLRGKVVVAVNEDIDPWDADAVNWAISFRMQPHRDSKVVKGQLLTLDHSIEPLDAATKRDVSYRGVPESTVLLIDATLKWPYPPISLPKKEFMERALQIWREMDLPALKLKEPWWGYNLGYWTEEYEEWALAAVKGEYYRTGEIITHRRKAVL